MTETEHLLTVVAEECAEVAQRVSKALRFGLHEIQPGHQFQNGERIMHEVDDLIGAISECQIRGILPNNFWPGSIRKREKIHEFLAYSRKVGTLTDGAPTEFKDNCPECGKPWEDHDFGVPKPFCP